MVYGYNVKQVPNRYYGYKFGTIMHITMIYQWVSYVIRRFVCGVGHTQFCNGCVSGPQEHVCVDAVYIVGK